MSAAVYKKTIAELKSREASLLHEQAQASTNNSIYLDRLNNLLPKLKDLRTAFNDMDLLGQATIHKHGVRPLPFT